MVTSNQLERDKPLASSGPAPLLRGLISDLTADASHLFRQEVALVKVEAEAKAREVSYNLALLMAGVFILCNGVILALAGVSYGIAQLFQIAGFGRLAANSLGFLFFGSLIIGSGVGLSLYAKNKLTPGS